MPNDNDPPRNRPWNKGRDRDDDDDDDRPRRRRRDDDEDDDRPRARRPRDDEDDDFDRPRKPQGSNGLAVAGLVLGILSFCTVGLAGLPAILCSVIALGKPAGRGMAIAGLALGGLGILAWIGLGGMFYMGVKPARERVKDQNNMKQVGIAFHNQHDSNGGMMGPYAQGPMGINRDLSFRVGLLPYIEQDNVYRQFDLSQAWNSPKNRPYSDTKIATYTSPYGEEKASVNTPYRVFYGGGAIFNEDGKMVPLARILDGTSNTILFVHATEEVRWAEPREFKYSDNAPLPKLGQQGAKGFNAAFADGSIRFINNTIPERTLRLLITKDDGNAIPDGGW